MARTTGPVGERTPRLAFAEASRQLLRSTVLSAVDELAADRPWPSVTMAQIATAAGVSRQTLYNEFGNREELVQAYVLSAAAQFLDEVEREIVHHTGDLSSALTAAFELFLELAGEHPLARALGAATGAEGLQALVSTPAGLPILTGATDRLVRITTDTWPGVNPSDAELICEVIVRLAISHLTMPTDTPAAAARRVYRVLEPFLAGLSVGLDIADPADPVGSSTTTEP